MLALHATFFQTWTRDARARSGKGRDGAIVRAMIRSWNNHHGHHASCLTPSSPGRARAPGQPGLESVVDLEPCDRQALAYHGPGGLAADPESLVGSPNRLPR